LSSRGPRSRQRERKTGIALHFRDKSKAVPVSSLAVAWATWSEWDLRVSGIMSKAFSVPVRLVRGATLIGATAKCETTWPSPNKRVCAITLTCDLGTFQAEEWNYFYSLCRIREQLESLGWRPFCYGANRNCFPSGMAADMGQGLKVYRTQLGSRDASTLVRVFDEGPDVEPVTVEEQRAFRKRWSESKGSRGEWCRSGCAGRCDDGERSGDLDLQRCTG
jgi:hypothetical protein